MNIEDMNKPYFEALEAFNQPNNNALTIEEGFSKYLITGSEKALYSYVKTGAEKLLSGYKFDVHITNKDRKEPFFGMRVFPNAKLISSIAHDVVVSESNSLGDIYRRWKDISSWDIEIDAQMFDRHNINLNPKEMTAMLLHELGHVIISCEPVERFYRAYLECQYKASESTKVSQKTLYFIYSIPLSVACLQKTWIKRNEQNKVEIKADAYPIEMGYGEHLVSCLEKILKAQGSVLTDGNSDPGHFDNELTENILWSNIVMNDFMVRRENATKKIMLRVSRRANNSYFQKVAANITQRLGAGVYQKNPNGTIDAWSYRPATEADFNLPTDEFAKTLEWGFAHEAQVLLRDSLTQHRNAYNVAMEGFLKNDFKRLIPTQYDIDLIAVEIDKIETQADRIYVLDLIHANMEKVTRCEELIEKHRDGKRYAMQVATVKSQLETLRTNVLSKHKLGKDYKFFVRYPEGYEG